jgi:hypothetical protein
MSDDRLINRVLGAAKLERLHARHAVRGLILDDLVTGIESLPSGWRERLRSEEFALRRRANVFHAGVTQSELERRRLINIANAIKASIEMLEKFERQARAHAVTP